MKHNPRSPAAIVVGVSFAALASTAPAQEQGAAPTSTLEPQDCVTDALTTLGAECYLFTGEEDWDEPNGTLVKMPVAVFNADAASPEEPPVFFFPGGPGYSSLGNRDYLEQLLKDVGDRTLVTMDHRGFIHSEPALRCPGYAEVSPYHDIIHTPAITSSPDPLERIAPVAEQVEACYEKLVSEGVDPAQYNQHTVSRDVDEIRRHLGYETIRPYGSSTGSGTAPRRRTPRSLAGRGSRTCAAARPSTSSTPPSNEASVVGVFRACGHPRRSPLRFGGSAAGSWPSQGLAARD